MVTEWGMSERVGLVTYKSDNPIFLGRDMEAHSGYSDETASVIDDEVHKIIEEAHARAVELLTANRKILDNMARVLIERETIYTEEVDMLLEGASPDEVYAHMDKYEKMETENPFARFVKEETGTAKKQAEQAEKGATGDAAAKKQPQPAEKPSQPDAEPASGTTPDDTNKD